MKGAKHFQTLRPSSPIRWLCVWCGEINQSDHHQPEEVRSVCLSVCRMLDRRIHEMEGNHCDNPSLPSEDSLIQILLWVPVISLLRFKSVCKSWRAIIQNPFFINTHATFLNTTRPPVFLRYSYYLRRGNIFTVSVDEVLEDLGIPGPEFEVLEDLGPNPSTYYRNINRNAHYKNITMAGCCNGIICLHDKDNPKCYIHTTISLWNPAIKQYRFLPIPFVPLEQQQQQQQEEDYVDYIVELGVDVKKKYVEHFVGFGFDVKTKDYKVLLITYDIYVDREYFYARGVQVYSLSTDSWRSIDASDAQPNLIIRWEDRDQGHYLNGTYLFIAGYLYEAEEATTNSNSRQEEECFRNVIMSFDFTQEIFRTIQLPFDLKLKTETRNYAYVILFGEKIAVTNACCDTFSSRSACLDIWVLNEYGGSESWSKLYTFVSDARPKFISDNGEFILLDDCQDVTKLQLLNVVTEEIKDLQYDLEGLSQGNGVTITRVGVYKPSLIPIAGNVGATNN